MKAWVRNHAYKAPASHVHVNGKYEENLVKKSLMVTDVKDTYLCPSSEQVFINMWNLYKVNFAENGVCNCLYNLCSR